MLVEKLSHLSLIKISGEDATSFLQGQLTNDVALASNNWQHTGYCTPKGRLFALLILWKFDQDYYALLDKTITETTLKRLRMYIMRSKVVIEELENNLYGVMDCDYEKLNQLDLDNIDLTESEKTTFISNKQTHFLSFGDRAILSSDQPLDKKLEAIESNSRWLIQDINDGIANINLLNTELFIPQMINLDVIGGINFKKGCYTGQEVVARMHYLGKLKQRMFVCKINKSTGKESDIEQIQAGDKIFSDESLTSSAGTIVNITNDHALAVLRLDSIDLDGKDKAQSVFSLNQEVSLEINQQQPYSFET